MKFKIGSTLFLLTSLSYLPIASAKDCGTTRGGTAIKMCDDLPTVEINGSRPKSKASGGGMGVGGSSYSGSPYYSGPIGRPSGGGGGNSSAPSKPVPPNQSTNPTGAGPCAAAAEIYNNYGYECKLLWTGYYACKGEDGFDWRLKERGSKCLAEETLPSLWKDFDPGETNIILRPSSNG